MSSLNYMERNWFHPVVLVLPLILIAGVISMNWKLFLILCLLELYSTSWHTTVHHPGSYFASPIVRVLTVVMILLMSWIFFRV